MFIPPKVMTDFILNLASRNDHFTSPYGRPWASPRKQCSARQHGCADSTVRRAGPYQRGDQFTLFWSEAGCDDWKCMTVWRLSKRCISRDYNGFAHYQAKTQPFATVKQ
ncbi:hypothetical protein [Pseudomonas sp. NA-150]|uniref:hypothetical protein n=1 Tax=Pseudomonas sp. NA-150 TaxID=3367525 RepID=UPI0037CCB26A